MEFNELNLHPDLQRGIAEAAYNTCMPVQEQVLSRAFSGQDLYVQSQTGTGKTAAFLIVIFQRLLADDQLAGKKAIIMVPTRELAVQVEEEAKLLGKYLPFKIGSFYGGVGYTQQEKLLKDNVRILVGTPGRVLDLNKSGRMNLMDIAFLVLDEADRMFDMGFYPDLRKLIRVVPPADRRQTMLFSATLNAWVKNLAWEYTKTPCEIEIAPETITVDEVDQILYHVPSQEKTRLLLGILEREKPESAVIFCNTKRYTEIIAKRLNINGYKCEFIIGDLPQSRRLKVIDDVKAGKIKYLVATDVAARGLDIEGLAMVINYDLPVESENYVHRIGRTARAGKTGRAITLASEQDVYELPAIERYIGKKIPSEISTPALYTEDKSAGTQIRTEFYEDRREERRLHNNAKAGEGRGARPHGDGNGRNRGGDGRSRSNDRFGPRHEERHGDRARGDRARHGDRTRATEGKRFKGNTAEPHKSAGNAAPADTGQDLSRLSFEDRMALYKQKYNGKPQNAEGRGRKAADGETRREGQSSSGREGRQGEAGRREGQSAGQREQAGRKKQRNSPQGSATQKPAPAEQPAPVKKGIFSRLKGIFKKKN
ncbi:hypothetical protein AGMMS50293_15320 [Spirochaetia bacterium]|nr:hypothetical protein AGMMS50293_15320 [Spirochaetia bacterium]